MTSSLLQRIGAESASYITFTSAEYRAPIHCSHTGSFVVKAMVVDTRALFVGSPDDRTASCDTEDTFTLLLWNAQQDLLYTKVSSLNNNCHQEQYN